MKVLLLCLFLFLREASGGVIEAPAYSSALVPETGTSSQYRSQDVVNCALMFDSNSATDQQGFQNFQKVYGGF